MIEIATWKRMTWSDFYVVIENANTTVVGTRLDHDLFQNIVLTATHVQVVEIYIALQGQVADRCGSSWLVAILVDPGVQCGLLIAEMVVEIGRICGVEARWRH